MINEASYFMTDDSGPIPWLDTRLTAEELQYLKSSFATISPSQVAQRKSKHGAGNVSRCDLIDKDNWFYENVLKKYTEKMFYDNVAPQDKDKPLPEFKLQHMWANFQHKHDHVPLHNHGGQYSFVVFIKIPTHWKEQHIPPNGAVPLGSAASDFAFVWAGKKGSACPTHNFFLCPEDEGRILFFPNWLQHIVYPFYDCEEERITVSGNIFEVTCTPENIPPPYQKVNAQISSEDPKEMKEIMQKFKDRSKFFKEI